MAGLRRITQTLWLVGLAACETASPGAVRDASISADGAAGPDAGLGDKAARVEGGGLSSGRLSGTLDVHVIDASNGDPVADASIIVGAQKVTADEAGHARLDELSGTVQVSVSATDFVPTTWLGVGTAQVTIPMRPRRAEAPPEARARARVEGLSKLAARDDGATFVLRLLASLPSDLEGFDGEQLTNAPEASVCRFAAGELDACSLEVVTRVGPQRLYAVIDAVDEAGKLIEPVAVSVSPEVTLAAGVTDLTMPLSLLAASDTIRAAVQAAEPPLLADNLKVVGVPGMKLTEGDVMLFAAGDEVILPRAGGSLGDGTYWYISEASYVDADGDALRLRVARRGLDGGELAQGPWPEVGARPVLEEGVLTLSSTEAALRRIVVRNREGEPLLDALLIGAAKALDLPAEVTKAVGGTEIEEIYAIFDPLEFALPDVLALSLWEIERSSQF